MTHTLTLGTILAPVASDDPAVIRNEPFVACAHKRAVDVGAPGLTCARVEIGAAAFVNVVAVGAFESRVTNALERSRCIDASRPPAAETKPLQHLYA
jgi:hypothetical protein